MNRALPRAYPSALEAFDQNLDRVREYARKIVDENDRLKLREIELMRKVVELGGAP